jgi:SAM-dependent methyltransferase
MGLKRQLLDRLNGLVRPLQLRVLSSAEFADIERMFLPSRFFGPPTPASARDYLSMDNPRIAELRERYRRHPAAAHSHWDEGRLLAGFDLREFRRDSHYVWQGRRTKPETYLLTAFYLRERDSLGLFARLTEDGLFGATTVPFENGHLLSRDLLDSVNEISLLARWFDLESESALTVLDIGAGYGRFAHRLVNALAKATITCVDAVPISTFLCEYYVQFRALGERAEVLTLDRAEAALAGRRFDLVTNIHSFSECTCSAIDWWFQCLDGVKVDSLLIVPNDGEQLLSIEPDGTRRNFEPLLQRHGWRPSRQEPIYLSETVRRYGLFPAGSFRLFAR